MQRRTLWLSAALCIAFPAILHAAPIIGTSPSSLGFGSVLVLSGSDLPLTIQNTGNTGLIVSSWTVSGTGASAFSLVSPPALPLTVNPGGSVTLTVRFQPVARGLKTATLTIASNDTVTPNKVVALTGSGVAPVISLSPTSLTYGLVEVGTNLERTFAVSNVGDPGQTLVVNNVSIPIGASQFAYILPGSLTVAPGSSITITVQFRPTVIGTTQGTVAVASNDPVSPNVSVALTGTGGVPTAALSPTSLPFGEVHTETSSDQVLQVQNVGAGTLNVTGLAFSGTHASLFSLVSPPALPFSVPQGGNVPLTVRFLPTSAGDKVASLVVTSGPANNQTSANLTGTGIRPEPRIAGVRDVPNDQGGKLKLFWDASTLDRPGSLVDHYWILRSVPPHTPRAALGLFYTSAATDTIYWELIATIQALHFIQGYSYVASTLGDSTALANPRTWFLVMALDAGNTNHWDSAPDSGYSVDNLPPASPASFTAVYSGGATHLHWQRNGESDLGGYHVYRGSTASFVPGAGNLISVQADTGFVDPGPSGAYYKLSALDVHDNESPFASIEPGSQVGVPASAPSTPTLARPQPNPSPGNVDLSFALSRPGNAELTIFDSAGRLVRELARGPSSAGPQRVHWDGRDDAGRNVGAGVYFVKLEAEGFALRRRLVVVR